MPPISGQKWVFCIQCDLLSSYARNACFAQVGADGARSQMLCGLEALTERVRGVALKENLRQTRVYRTIIMPLPETPEWNNESSYSQRSPSGRVFECLPTKEGWCLASP
jgi:hypothetical protein